VTTALVPAGQRLFGTDGIRSPFGGYPLDRPTVTALAVELGTELVVAGGSRRPQVVLGGDTRASTPELCRWLAAGLAAAGVDTLDAGVIPTPGVAFLVRRHRADAGIAVSASHNPYPDNGIKLVDRDGFKWSAAAERSLEEAVAARLGGGVSLVGEAATGAPGGVAHDQLGKRDSNDSTAGTDFREDYLAALAASLPGERPLAGLRIALDPANGAASSYAGPLFTRLGTMVTTLCAEPDGRNINQGCGSTAPERLAAMVADGADVGGGAFDLGIAFDGDADRAILVDEGGRVHDGDAILYLWASALREAGELDPPTIAVTSMSNFGLERALARHGVGVVRCGVGDRQVVETMRRDGLLLGGEQSGHVVHLGLATTGDGLLTAVQVAAIVRRAGRPLSALVAPFERFPQLLVNVPVAAKPPFATLPRVAAAARAVEAKLAAEGRLVLRYSGTEPLARVMVEGADQAVIETLASELAAAIRAEIGSER
jgi:phosphoglucosamine mutase